MLRLLRRLEAKVPREEARLGRDLRRQRRLAGDLIAEVRAQLNVNLTAEELDYLTRALEQAGSSQRTTGEALLRLARAQLERAQAAVAEEDADDALPTLH